MTRLCYPCALLLALPLFGRSQQPEANETVIKLNVQAMAAAKPALRYQLLPELREMNPGNPVQGFMKCLMEQDHLFTKEEIEKWDKLDDAPLKELPLDKLRDYGKGLAAQAHFAARLDAPDWLTLLKLKQDGIALLIPEVQKMRDVAHVLTRRLRVEIADGRLDDALHTTKTLFALARMLGEHPTLIGDLVGLYVARLTLERVEEMLAQPGSPNLFWALTDLPHPFIDLRKGYQGERVWDVSFFDKVDDKKPMSDAQLQDVEKLFRVTFRQEKVQEEPGRTGKWIAAHVKDKAYVQSARKRLIDFGRSESIVKQFPDLQVVLLDGKLRYDIARDDSMKAASLPFWQAGPLVGNVAKEKEDPFLGMVPATINVLRAQARLEQRLALLRCVEALRIYAAEHDGKLPAQLADTKLPLPVDPVTGREFQYKLDGGTAHLRGSPPPGMEKQAPYNLRYEVSIRK